ncbi:MAG TPA: beta-galactosidase [Lachnospiraceae bacterium]|nr:beta-galactosidase [Lachnospiraceae bacterium]
MKTTEFGYNSNYMLKDQKPWFPVMGEIHYSRYPKQYWRESLYKMKAGGVEVVSSYVIWIHHEEIEKEYDFTGNKDLREFITACKDCGLSLVLRIGPWSHAEVRNGGFPDWLLGKDYEVRTNDTDYLLEVRRFYTKIYEQTEGLFLKDGGPVIGVQIENEYGHCGGLDGEEGERHMRLLTQMAKEIGFDVPIYTATGWGGAVTGGLLPVMGGYCEAPWDQRLTEIEPSGNYVFTHERNDHNIGSDYGFGTGITFDISKFPYLTAELGGGLQVTHHRRPVAYSTDIGAMSMVKLGSGVNLLGYYMYHGGTNPEGKLTTLQESRATGSINDLPVLNYDFRAPIREYGQISETFKEIKLLTMFLKDFGSEICEMPAIIPESNPLFPTNFTDLRTSYRYKGDKGYIFVNNYQRRYAMENHKKCCTNSTIRE